MRKLKICFVSLNIYPLLLQNSNLEFIGGAELQQFLLGKELAKRGYEISFITMDHGQKVITYIDLFKVISTYKPNKGMPVFRFIYPRLYKIWKALYKSDADIYYVRTASFILAIVALYARLNGKKVVYSGADDRDFDPKLVSIPIARDKLLYLWGLRNTDEIVLQNKRQQQILEKNFKRSGKVIHNFFYKVDQIPVGKTTILWVSNLREKKRPRLFLELAKRFPNEKFVMVGGKFEKCKEDYESVEVMAKQIPNLEFKGFLQFKETEEEFSKAKLFVNTSEYEGFPNTFLQAWSRGIPIISFIDLDGMIQDFSLGIVVNNMEEMIQKVDDILCKKKKFSPERIKQYFEENFIIERSADLYEEIFKAL